MKNLKICVYGIAKNESKFVNRFMDCLKEIKDVFILDTGSTDNTVELFKARGAIVNQKTYEHFTFDVARNDALSFVPEDFDVCISLDIDECIEPGFVDVIKEVWQDDTKAMSYFYYTGDSHTNAFFDNKIHLRKDFTWVYPIHEVVRYIGDGEYKEIKDDRIKVYHNADKSKSRSFYLDLLEERVKNVPNDERNTRLLAREYLNIGENEKCIEWCNKYYETFGKNTTQIAKVFFYNAYALYNLKDYEAARDFAAFSNGELGGFRDAYALMCMIDNATCNYKQLIEDGLEGLKYDKVTVVHHHPIGINGTLEYLVAEGYYRLGDYIKAREYINKALEIKPNALKYVVLKEKLK